MAKIKYWDISNIIKCEVVIITPDGEETTQLMSITDMKSIIKEMKQKMGE